MRPELERLLHLEWWTETPGFSDHVGSILDMKLTAAEREELCALLESATNLDYAMVWAAIMEEDPHPEYHRALKKALENPNPEIVYYATQALVAGKYPRALELVFADERIQRIAGDRLAKLIPVRKLSEEMAEQFLDLFCQRFGEATPELEWDTEGWFRALARLGLANDRVAAILRRIWDELQPADADTKFLLLRAMAGSPHPSYQPIFKQAKKSTDEELRDMGKAGLDELKRP